TVDGIEGSPVYLQLKGGNMIESSHIEWKTGNIPVAEFKENNTGYHGDSKNRSEIVSNGTLKLDSTQEHDTETYSVDVFNGNGNIIQHETVQLFIINAVSKPELNYTCTPDGKVEFHCFLEKGADPSFTWSLNYKTLDGNSAPHSVKSQRLVLKHITGYVVCTAENSVSKQQSPIVFYSCEESKEVHPVYVILGSSVFLHAGNKNAQSTSDIRWKKGDTLVVRVKNNVTHLYNVYRYRAEIFTNGTLRLDSTRERDSGIYIVERFNRHGKLLSTEAHHLITINVVSQPLVNYSCRHNKNVQFHCSVQNGDYLMFQWSLNGNTLDGKNASSRNKTAVLALNETISGSLICIVGNNISKSQSEPLSFTCTGKALSICIIQ
ncbi:UNVERIFIED_CONTAM: hypothetical protein FKN15_039426, partial [Acipenser sinensis]